jgi:hypothetical protein
MITHETVRAYTGAFSEYERPGAHHLFRAFSFRSGSTAAV